MDYNDIISQGVQQMFISYLWSLQIVCGSNACFGVILKADTAFCPLTSTTITQDLEALALLSWKVIELFST